MQTRQWSCGTGPSCNCGAVLRDHNDVIAFSCCNDLLTRDVTTPITVKILSKKCLAPGISIRNTIQGVNGQYEVSKFITVQSHISISSATCVPSCNDQSSANDLKRENMINELHGLKNKIIGSAEKTEGDSLYLIKLLNPKV